MHSNKYAFFFFGSDAQAKVIGEAIKSDKLRLVSQSDNTKGRMKNEEKVFGSVFGTPRDDYQCFFAYEKENVTNGTFPIDFKKHSVTFPIPKPTTNTIQLFENFVIELRRFESFMRAYLSPFNKAIETQAELIPQGFYGMLQYEFFREVIEHASEIEIALAHPHIFGDVNAVVVMILVKGQQEQDNLEISDLVVY